MSATTHRERLAAAVRSRLRELGWSQARLSRESGISPDTLTDLVQARRRSRPQTTRPVARALGWPEDGPERILGGEDAATALAGSAERDDGSREGRRASIDFLSGYEEASADDLLEVLDAARGELADDEIAGLVGLIVTRALDELVSGTGWMVRGARPDWGADLVVSDRDGVERVLVESRLAPTRGFVPVDEVLGRALRMRARMSRIWDRDVEYWVVFTADPGPQVVAAFADVDVPVGWVGDLPDLPDVAD